MSNINTNLNMAQKAKKDEFYTQLSDIENELQHYKSHFENKTVYCNCDGIESNFAKYFIDNFSKLKLKKLICTTIHTNIKFVYDGVSQHIENLKETGDFRSPECIELLKEADIVVTNPPFSLFREYVAQLMEYEKKFVIVGNQTSIAYKEIFPLLKENKMWLGFGFKGNVGFFESPYEDRAVSSQHKEGKIRVSGVMWFTNLDIQKHHEMLTLYKTYTPEEYPKYDNYDAIEVKRTKLIPSDYDGMMGVPITFMDKYCSEQFEIVGLLNSSTEEEAGIKILREYNDFKEMRQDGSFTGDSGSKANGNPVLSGKSKKGNFLFNEKTGEYVHSAYSRILIKLKRT